MTWNISDHTAEPSDVESRLACVHRPLRVLSSILPLALSQWEDEYARKHRTSMGHCPQKCVFDGETIWTLRWKRIWMLRLCTAPEIHTTLYITLYTVHRQQCNVWFNLNQAILLNNRKAVLSLPYLSLFHMCRTKNTNKRNKMLCTIKPSNVLCVT